MQKMQYGWMLAAVLLLGACATVPEAGGEAHNLAQPAFVQAEAAPVVQALAEDSPPPVMLPPDPKLELARYVGVVQRLIRSQMRFGEKVKGNPEVVLEVKLKKTLRLASVRVVKSSGNKGFDAAVKLAVQKAGRYPPLPNGVEFSIIQSHKIKYRLNETA